MAAIAIESSSADPGLASQVPMLRTLTVNEAMVRHIGMLRDVIGVSLEELTLVASLRRQALNSLDQLKLWPSRTHQIILRTDQAEALRLVHVGDGLRVRLKARSPDDAYNPWIGDNLDSLPAGTPIKIIGKNKGPFIEAIKEHLSRHEL